MTISDINSFLVYLVSVIFFCFAPFCVLAIIGYLLKPSND